MEYKQHILLEQKQIIAANQIQSLELLSLSNADLDTFVQNEYIENPMLESMGTGKAAVGADDFWGWYSNIPEKTETLTTYIWEQLESGKYTKKEHKVIDVLIGCLDHNGFFNTPPEEIETLTNASREMVGNCLRDLKQLEPCGIFSENLSECLLRQLDVLNISDETLKTIIRDHLGELSEGRISSITHKLNISSATVRKYNAFILTLNPRPLTGFGREMADFVVPDILVAEREGGYEITLNDNWMADYQLNDYYVKMLHETKDPELLTYFMEKKRRASFILEAIEQRRKTVLKIMSAVIALQGGRLPEKRKLKPLTMKEVANHIEMHVSTVSRAVKDKYVQYPKGTIAMKDFFSQPVSAGMNADQMKAEIARLISKEDKKNPHSDQKLERLLQEKGMMLSRRTVAKYREAMGIKGSFDRKIADLE